MNRRFLMVGAPQSQFSGPCPSPLTAAVQQAERGPDWRPSDCWPRNKFQIQALNRFVGTMGSKNQLHKNFFSREVLLYQIIPVILYACYCLGAYAVIAWRIWERLLHQGVGRTHSWNSQDRLERIKKQAVLLTVHSFSSVPAEWSTESAVVSPQWSLADMRACVSAMCVQVIFIKKRLNLPCCHGAWLG